MGGWKTPPSAALGGKSPVLLGLKGEASKQVNQIKKSITKFLDKEN